MSKRYENISKSMECSLCLPSSERSSEILRGPNSPVPGSCANGGGTRIWYLGNLSSAPSSHPQKKTKDYHARKKEKYRRLLDMEMVPRRSTRVEIKNIQVKHGQGWLGTGYESPTRVITRR